MMRGLLPRLALLAIAGFVVLSSPLLAGLGGAGAWTVGVFAVIFAVRYVLTTDPAEWSHPAVPAIAAGVNALVAGLLWLLGGWLRGALGWAPDWGAMPPILLAVAGTALSAQLWSARRDAALSDITREADALRHQAEELSRLAAEEDDGDLIEDEADALRHRTDAMMDALRAVGPGDDARPGRRNDDPRS